MGVSITSANASVSLTIPGVYSSGVLLQNFAQDDMFDADPQTLTESRVGADGFSAIGYVFNRGKMRLTFQANSASIPVLYAWKAAQDGQEDAIPASLTIVSSPLGLDVELTTVSIGTLPAIPPHKKVVEPLSVEIEFDPLWQTSST